MDQALFQKLTVIFSEGLRLRFYVLLVVISKVQHFGVLILQHSIYLLKLSLKLSQIYWDCNYIESKMRFFKLLTSVVQHADFFSTTQLIRYQEEPQFKTFTGGIFSLIIVILLGIIFFNMSLSAVRRQHIDWSGQTAKDDIPPRLELNFSTFNIGVELQGFNLSSSIQYFDVIMRLYSYQNKQLQGGAATRIPMKMCRREDWAINSDILDNFDRMNATNWLCPDVSSSFFVQGKWTSDKFSYLSLDVLDCGTANPNAVCANRSQIDKALQNTMHFSVYYINALVTPDQKQPISYYLQDKDYVYFGKNNGGANYIFISDYKIKTDNSIIPFQDNHYQNGGIVMVPTRISVQDVGKGWYASFYFRKAVDRYIYTRRFNKFDSVVSYIGGLFGALIGVLFLMNHYTRTSFEIALGSSIYNDDDQQSEDAKNMNLFRYVKYHIYRFLLVIGSAPNWKTYQKFEKCRAEIQKHLDIKFILQKLNFMERAIFAMCGQQKFKALHLRTKVTIQDASKFRDYYFLRSSIINDLLKKKKQKKQNFSFKKKEGRRDNQVSSPSSILSQNTPFFKIGKGKIMPIQPPIINQQLSANRDMTDKDEAISDSVRTHKLTRKTRRYIEQMRSYLSSIQSVEIDNPGVEIGGLAIELEQIKREGDNGDVLCRQIWTNLDSDIKFIMEQRMKRFGQDIILQRQDISNSANQVYSANEPS